MLFETRLDDGRWVGHAENGALVAAHAGGPVTENAIGRVAIDGIDTDVPDRAVGSVLAVDLPHRRPLTVLAQPGVLAQPSVPAQATVGAPGAVLAGPAA